MLVSFVVASTILVVSLGLVFAELAGMARVVHPLFWLTISAGALGVAGSNYLYWRTYLKRP